MIHKQIDSRIEKILISEHQINQATKKAAKWIDLNYANKQPILVAILKGAIPFFAKVLSNVKIDVQTDFVVFTSYNGGVVNSNKLNMVTDLKSDIKDRHVIVFDDLCDSGRTLKTFVDMLKKRNPASIKVMCLGNKQAKRQADINPDYYCFDLPDEFLVGFGLDYKEYMRNIPYIGVFNHKIFDQELAKLAKKENK